MSKRASDRQPSAGSSHGFSCSRPRFLKSYIPKSCCRDINFLSESPCWLLPQLQHYGPIICSSCAPRHGSRFVWSFLSHSCRIMPLFETLLCGLCCVQMQIRIAFWCPSSWRRKKNGGPDTYAMNIVTLAARSSKSWFRDVFDGREPWHHWFLYASLLNRGGI